jgi:hypothetical protein
MTMVFLLSGCAQKTSVPAETAVTETVKEETSAAETTAAQKEIEINSDKKEEEESGDYYSFSEKREEKDGKIRSYLTGEMVDASQANRRPIAIMMSNDKAACPQYGINRAGVVYEAPVEGGMNRYMSIIENYDDLDRIGSVRSCRTYYTYFAREFDAIYAHYGQSTFAKPYLENVDNINGLDAIGTTAYYRSTDKKSPHNAYSSGERLKKSIEKLGYSEEYDSAYRGHYLFAKDGKEASLEDRPGVMDAMTVKPGYPINQPYFVYDETDGLYHRYQHGDVHRGSEGPITAKNIILQYCQSGYYATTEYLAINVHTSECGYLITDGKAIPLSWEKDGEFGVTHYYDLDHNEVVLNQGQTWVCIISTKDFNKTQILGKDGAQ